MYLIEEDVGGDTDRDHGIGLRYVRRHPSIVTS